MEEMKTCAGCKIEKPMTEEFYYKNPTYSCGFGNECKVCINDRRIANKAIRNEKNRLKTLERNRKAAETK